MRPAWVPLVMAGGVWPATVASGGAAAGAGPAAPPGRGELPPPGTPPPSAWPGSTFRPRGRPCPPPSSPLSPRSAGRSSSPDEGAAGLAGTFAGAWLRGAAAGTLVGRDLGEAERNRGAASRLAAPRVLFGRSKRAPPATRRGALAGACLCTLTAGE